MPGGILRTNYRKTGGTYDATILGKGYALGSWAAGAGVHAIAGVVAGSWSGTATSNTMSIEAASAIASFFGCDALSRVDGYKIYPFYVKSRADLAGSGTSYNMFFGSISTSDGASQMFFYQGGREVSVATSDWSGHVNWVGLIVSTP